MCLVSIIIPTYKRADLLERAIKSILNQSFKNVEIIVVDDNDSDSNYRTETEHIMKEFEEYQNIFYIKHEHNRNGAVARNTGIKHARGKFIGFLDDDDEFHPTKLEKQVALLEKSSDEIFGVRTGYQMVKNGRKIYENKAKEKGNLKVELLKNDIILATNSSVLFKKDKILNIGGFDSSFIRHQDIELMLRLFNIGNIETISEILVSINADDPQNRPNGEKLDLVKTYFFESFSDDINKLSDNDRKIVYLNHKYEVAKIFLKGGELKKFTKYLFSNKICFKFIIKFLREFYLKVIKKELA